MVECRSGFDLTEDELDEIDKIVTPLILRGQSPYHILRSHPEIPVSIMTLYRLIDSGRIGARNIDLKQKVRRKSRKRSRTKIFFCDPNRSDQKGAAENNHKLIRDVIPKGTSLIPYNQSDTTLMMNHINSYRRKSLYDFSAYDKAMRMLPEGFFDQLGLYRV